TERAPLLATEGVGDGVGVTSGLGASTGCGAGSLLSAPHAAKPTRAKTEISRFIAAAFPKRARTCKRPIQYTATDPTRTLTGCDRHPPDQQGRLRRIRPQAERAAARGAGGAEVHRRGLPGRHRA